MTPEQKIDHKIIKDISGSQIITDVGNSGWGHLYLSKQKANPEKQNKKLRVAVFGSYLLGYLLFETLKKFQQTNPEYLEIVGLVTDDPASPDAKISVRRRIWRLYDEKETMNLETAMVESGVMAGIPVYTGAVKTDYFRNLLAQWDPDVILVCVFGQIIDKPIIDYPSYGIYNFHPADLAAHHGAGPRPFQDLIDRNAETSKVTIHHLTEQLDSGPIIGQSSPINVRFKDGTLTDNILILDDKMLEPIDVMGAELIKTLCEKKTEGLKGKVNKIDFSKHFSPEYRKNLLLPIQSREPSDVLPEPSKFVDYTIG